MAGSAQAKDDQDSGRRAIAPGEWQRQRFGWLEAIRGAEGLNPTAKIVAHALALDFADRDTLQCNPSHEVLGACVKVSKATVKRAINDLISAGWIDRRQGHGRGNSSGYVFLTRAKIVPIKGVKYDPLKGCKSDPFYEPEKGSNMTRKGVKYDPPLYNSLEPCKNHGGETPNSATQKNVAAKFSDNPNVQRDAQAAVAAFRDGRAHAFDDLQPWVLAHVLWLDELTDDERRAAGFA